MKKGTKRGPYTKGAATKKKSKPTAASTAMLAAFVASGNSNAAPQGGPDNGLTTTPLVLAVDDKSKTHANDCGAKWQLAADTRGLCPLDHDHDMGGA